MTPDERADLKQKYLLALLTRDAKIWRERIEAPLRAGVGVGADDGETLSSAEVEKKSCAIGATYNREDPCLHCGTHARYVRDDSCVACAKARDKRADKAKKLARAAATASQPVRRPTLGLRQTQMRVRQAPDETPVEMTSD
jgi:hypothetical protein